MITIDIKKIMDSLIGVKKTPKKFTCLCDMNKDGLSISGYCHKHHTDWL
jgi:hypothetical protein